MNQLSIENYFAGVKPNLTKREIWVLEALEDIAPASAQQVADYLKVGIHIVSGRFTGLKKKNMIVPTTRELNSLGNMVQLYRPKGMRLEYEND